MINKEILEKLANDSYVNGWNAAMEKVRPHIDAIQEQLGTLKKQFKDLHQNHIEMTKTLDDASKRWWFW